MQVWNDLELVRLKHSDLRKLSYRQMDVTDYYTGFNAC